MPQLTWSAIAPWHVAVALTVLCLMGYVLARVQSRRAREDWANAFFYSPSLKGKHRQRRQRWLDVSRAFLVGVVLLCAMTAALYFRHGV